MTLEVLSPHAGTVFEIKAQKDDIVTAGQVMFIIKSTHGLYEVKALQDGKIISMEVEGGDEVIPGMVLAFIS